MKKIIIPLVIIVGIASWGGSFYYKNFRGAGPALLPPEKNNTAESSTAESVNKTGMPLRIPRGFSMSIFAENLGNPRVLAWDPAGNLLVSVPGQGRVMALGDKNDDGVADGAVTVDSGLNRPHGIAIREGKLYIAETDGVAAYDYDTGTQKARNKTKLFDLPGGGNHFSRTIGFGPDDRLYVSVGSSCNVCIEKDWRRATMLVSNADGSGLKEFAKGLRNSVFFTWHPTTGDLWATDMGRDLIGDNIPPEEVNIVTEGSDYGWPYCYASRIHDDNFDSKRAKNCDTTVSPHITFQAHSAPLGLAFIPDSWPEEYRGDLLVAYHGSWNRTAPTGYKVVRFKLDSEGNSQGEEDFISGWFPSGGGESTAAYGRPVDLSFDLTGNLYISDDKAGVIYLVRIAK